MKALVITTSLLIAIGGFSQKAKNMEAEKRKIQETVTGIFVSTDSRDWSGVERNFNETVMLDYTSLAGGEPASLTPTQITESWKTVLPGFDHTHHAISNFNITIDHDEAVVSHYGEAEHFIDLKKGENIWKVVGTYNHHLIRTPNGWKVDRMKFNLKYMDGNMDLPRIAQEKVKGGGATIRSTAEQNKATVRAFFKLLEEEKIDLFIDLFAENGKQANPYASGLFPDGADGKEALKAYWEPVPGFFDGMEFPIEELYAMEDPSMVFAKYTGKIKLKAGSGTYENNYYSTFKFNEHGKILEYVEIFNPIVAARGFGLLDKIK